jgi:hypothetical protein
MSFSFHFRSDSCNADGVLAGTETSGGSVPEAAAAAMSSVGRLIGNDVAEPSCGMTERPGRKIGLGLFKLLFGKIESGLLYQFKTFFRKFSDKVFAETLLVDNLCEKGAG